MLCEVFATATLVFAPFEIVSFEDLMTLELLIDFLTPTVRTVGFSARTGAGEGEAASVGDSARAA
jgi:hypothetical protein